MQHCYAHSCFIMKNNDENRNNIVILDREFVDWDLF